MIKQFASFLLIMSLLLMMLTGCNKDSGDDESSGSVNSDGRTVLTLATFNRSFIINNAVEEFNSINPDYYVQISDYSEFNTGDDQYAGLLRLSTELISGSYPDILDVTNIPNYQEYAARGLLADLYPFIDSDSAFNRSDFIENPYRAAEIDGKLYQVFPYFYINTIVGNPYIVGTETDWSLTEFQDTLRDHPEADMPLGDWLTKTNFLQTAISFNIDKYIDWNSGTVSFDTPEFVQLLELSASFPDDPNWSSMYIGDGDVYIQSVSTDEAIATGRQILSELTLGGFHFYQYYKAIYGGEIVFKGFPNDGGSGNSFTVESSFAIIEQSPNKDGAWAFVRTILDKDWQLNKGSAITGMPTMHGFPTNRAAFEEKVARELEVDYSDGINGISVENLTQDDVDKVVGLIHSASGTSGWLLDRTLWDIISKAIAEYYKGNISAQSTADAIQSGVAIYMSERS